MLRSLFDLTPLQQALKLSRVEKTHLLRVVLCVCVVALVINFTFLWALNHSQINLGYSVIETKWTLAARQSEHDMLVLGDSSGDQGVDTDLLKQKYNIKALNLCTFGDMLLVDDVWLFEYYLRHSPAPRQVLLVHVYDVWHRDQIQEASLRQIPVSPSEWEYFTPLRPLGIAWKFRVAVDRYLPVISRRTTLRQLLENPLWALTKRQPTRLFSPTGFRRSNTPAPSLVRRDRQRHLEFLATAPFSVSEINRAAFRRLLELCDEHSVQLIIANSPIDRELAANPLFKNYYASLRHWLRTTVDEFDDVKLIEELFTVSESRLDRVDHVVHSAAIEFTAHLLDTIQ